MTTDQYKSVKINVGQEARAHDLTDLQSFADARLLDQIIRRTVAGDTSGLDPWDPSLHQHWEPNDDAYLYALTVGGGRPQRGSTNTKVVISRGTVFQKIDASDNGNQPVFLPFTFSGSQEFEIDPGDSTHPRFDLIQMKLELVDDDQQSRVFATAPEAAELDLLSITTDLDIQLAATKPGSDGDTIRVTVSTWAGPGVQVQESGKDVLISYVDGVSTVGDVVTALNDDASLVVITGSDNLGDTLNSPLDSGEAFLAGGLDTVLVSDLFDMKRRVQATINVKKGDATATPEYTEADSGYTSLAMVWVPALWDGDDPLSHFMEESLSDSPAVIHDLRMPMRVKSHTVRASDFIRDPGVWEDAGSPFETQTVKSNTTGPGGHHLLVVPCPVTIGRLVGVEMVSKSGTTGSAYVTPFFDPGGIVEKGADVSVLVGTTDRARIGVAGSVIDSGKSVGEFLNFPATVTGNFIRIPIWCNGGRVPEAQNEEDAEPGDYAFRFFEDSAVPIDTGIKHHHGISLVIIPVENMEVSTVIFHVAEGY